MKNITIFHENLLTAFAVANKNIIKRISGNVNGDELVVTIRSEHQGLCNCINSTVLTVHPGNKKHHMEIEEILVGYDEEGSPWSDHMGGRVIDCTGMDVDTAIDTIVAEMNEHI